MPLGIDPTVDYAFKRLFASAENKDLLVHLLNSILRFPTPIVEVQVLNPFNAKEFAEDKLSVLDLKAKCVDGRWYNIEMQNRIDLSLRSRLAYYSALLFTSQLQEGDDYAALMPAITICFLSETMFRETTAPHLRFTLSDQEHATELTDGLQVHTIELSKYNFQHERIVFANNLERWSFFLSEAARLEVIELKQLLPAPEFVKATQVMEMIAKTPEERMQYEARRKAELDHKWLLGIAKREGREEGREVGRDEGVKATLVQQIRKLQSLLPTTQLPEADLLQLPVEELNRLSEELFAKLTARNT